VGERRRKGGVGVFLGVVHLLLGHRRDLLLVGRSFGARKTLVADRAQIRFMHRAAILTRRRFMPIGAS
jgi:hypothetical protein